MEKAFVAARLADERRAWGVLSDEGVMQSMATEEFCGRSVKLADHVATFVQNYAAIPAYEPAYLGRRFGGNALHGLLLLAMWIVTCLIWFPLYGAAVSGPLLTRRASIETRLLCLLLAPNWRNLGMSGV